MLLNVDGSRGYFNLYGYRDILEFARDAVVCIRGELGSEDISMDFLPKEFVIVRNGHLYKVVYDGKVADDIDRTMYMLEHIPAGNRFLGDATKVQACESEGKLWIWLAGNANMSK